MDYIKNADKSIGKYMNFVGEEEESCMDFVI